MEFPNLSDLDRVVFSGVSLGEVLFVVAIITLVNMLNRIRRARMFRNKP